jgi:hypothetical protein
MKIPLHSMTDLITNSSTVIYTYSEGSEEALRKMIDKIFATFGIDKKCEDVFNLSVTLEKNYHYYEALDELDEEDRPEELRNLDEETKEEKEVAFVEKVLRNEIPKPEWMTDAEGENGDGYRPATTLNIAAKLPKYEELAKLVSDFLYSTGHEAVYN